MIAKNDSECYNGSRTEISWYNESTLDGRRDILNEDKLFSFGSDAADYTHTLTLRPNPDSVPFRLHSHKRHEIYYFWQGDADFSIEGTRYRLEKGMLLLSASGQVHHLTVNNPNIPYERTVIMFSLGLLPPEMEKKIILLRYFKDFAR